ncbi:CLAVATA3/ESR (CLE)-related protein 5-like [Senna tora]|uniref:CLAVATA3/ESR (CLE)-related protein 5-like n=1 Tax=Senna tora TaxID=362788 RepID=A0A834TID9_9FABA|nr:CLAVATA3/ESR (CLE)-related protein 5-like [Senna tora]
MRSSLFVFVLCFIIIVVSLSVVSSEARVLPKFLATIGHKKINSEALLRELVKDVRKSENFQHKRSMLSGNQKLERVSPAGPDPQHH